MIHNVKPNLEWVWELPINETTDPKTEKVTATPLTLTEIHLEVTKALETCTKQALCEQACVSIKTVQEKGKAPYVRIWWKVPSRPFRKACIRRDDRFRLLAPQASYD